MTAEQKTIVASIDNPFSAILCLPNDNSGLVTTGCSLKLPKDLSEEGWIEIGLQLGRVQQAVQWWLGDWWAFGEGHKYGSRKALVDAEDWQGPEIQTCMDAAWVCRMFEPSRRREVLSFKHHREVAGLAKRQADKLLDWCQETIAETGKPRSTRTLRDAVQRRAQVAAAAKAAKDAKVVKVQIIKEEPASREVTMRTFFVRSDLTSIEHAPVLRGAPVQAEEPSEAISSAIATIEATIVRGLETLGEHHDLHTMLLDAQAALAVLRAALSPRL